MIPNTFVTKYTYIEIFNFAYIIYPQRCEMSLKAIHIDFMCYHREKKNNFHESLTSMLYAQLDS